MVYFIGLEDRFLRSRPVQAQSEAEESEVVMLCKDVLKQQGSLNSIGSPVMVSHAVPRSKCGLMTAAMAPHSSMRINCSSETASGSAADAHQTMVHGGIPSACRHSR